MEGYYWVLRVLVSSSNIHRFQKTINNFLNRFKKNDLLKNKIYSFFNVKLVGCRPIKVVVYGTSFGSQRGFEEKP